VKLTPRNRPAQNAPRFRGDPDKPIPPLVLVGHGSRDPRSAATLHRLAARVRAGLPKVEVRLCFLELSVPSLEHVLSGLDGSVVVVPLLLGDAYHARTDLPGRVGLAVARHDRLRVRIATTLGADAALLDAAAQRAVRAPSCDGWILAATGSSHGPANAAVVETATDLSGRLRRPVRAGFVTAAPEIAAAWAGLREAGCTEIGVLPWFLAPGRLLDRAEAQAAALGVTTVTAPLADDAATARAVLARYAGCAGHWMSARASG
jgi:sirohydrochlorin ferrochelatase